MFDPKSLLEMMVRGAGAPQPQGGQSGGGGLGDLLGQMLGGGGAGAGAGRQGQGGAGGGGLEDLLRQLQGGAPGGAAQGGGGGGGIGDLLRNMVPGQSGGQAGAGAAPPSGGGGLGDLLGQLQKQAASPGAAPQSGQGGGGLLDMLGQILGQATSGVKEGAQRVDDATGASGQLRDMLAKATGKTPDQLMNEIKDYADKNKLAAGAAAGGLGAVVLGTRTGRSLAGTAVKIGALALIGGLAYKAMQNYQEGKPLITGSSGQPLALTEAPAGTGFESSALTGDEALLYIRAMIAAAAADGRIDAQEQERILGGLKQAGLDREAEEFLAKELNSPATAAELAEASGSDEVAVQVFTAARIAVDLDSQEEHDFLVALAQGLGLESELVAHIDATARAAAA